MPTGNLSRTCRWVLGELPDTYYCEKPVGWIMVADNDDGVSDKIRSYNSFCDEHQARFELAKASDDDETLDDYINGTLGERERDD